MPDLHHLAALLAALGLLCLGLAKSMHSQAFGPHAFEGCTPGYLWRMRATAILGALQLLGAVVLLALP